MFPVAAMLAVAFSPIPGTMVPGTPYYFVFTWPLRTSYGSKYQVPGMPYDILRSTAVAGEAKHVNEPRFRARRGSVLVVSTSS